MHCFIGLHVQEPLAGTILAVNHEWNRLGYPSADFHKHTYPHITLVPPFDTADTVKLIAGLNIVTNAFPQFDADYARVGVFNRRILHLAVESNGLVDLRAKLYEYGKGLFHYQDEHPVYHAHTTIAYMHDPLTDAAFSLIKSKLETQLALPIHQTVAHITLYGRQDQGEDYQIMADLLLRAK